MDFLLNDEDGIIIKMDVCEQELLYNMISCLDIYLLHQKILACRVVEIFLRICKLSLIIMTFDSCQLKSICELIFSRKT